MPQHHSCTQKRKLSIVKNTTTQNKMQGKAAIIGLLHSGSLNAKDNCSMIKKVEKLYLDFSLTIHYNEYINSFFLLPIRQSVSSLAAERLCFRSFSIKQEYCGFFCDARIPFICIPHKTAYIMRRHQETISWCLFVCRDNSVKENKSPLSGKNIECTGGDFILDQKTLERNMQHYLWLSYFNRTLRDQGVITMDEYRKMNHLIWTKYPVLKKV